MKPTKQLLAVISLLVLSFVADAQNTYPWPSSGNVGIGTTNPSSMVHVYSNTVATLTLEGATNNSAYGRLNMMGRPSGHGHSIGYIHVSSTQGGQSPVSTGAIDFAKEGNNADNASNIQFYTNSGSSLGERLRISAIGNVGIGTTTPTFKLDLMGSMRMRNPIENEESYTSFRIQGGQTFVNGLEIDFFGDSTRGGYDAGTYYAGYGGAAIVNVNAKPLVLGTSNAARLLITGDGNVGIGTTTPGEYKLAVNGDIKTRKINVTQSDWPDYVFHDSYKLKPLAEVAQFIKQNQHLPDMPSAKEVEQNGVSLGDNQVLLLKKIEELTLYLIEIKNENASMKAEVEQLKKKVNK